ncbi:MAG: hypothetical protein GX897_10545 [Clostridiales bacterium]|nr:hypothetical protein [Clostridiales bacterium]
MNEYTPPHNPKKAILISLLCFITAAGFLFAGALDFGYRLLMQLIALTAAVVGIQITSRFILSVYTYKVELSNHGGFDFIVIKNANKSHKIVCNLDMSTGLAIIPHAKPKDNEKRFGHIKRFFYYTSNMSPIKPGDFKNMPDIKTSFYDYIFEFNDEIQVIVIECSEEFMKYIEAHIGSPTQSNKDIFESPDNGE